MEAEQARDLRRITEDLEKKQAREIEEVSILVTLRKTVCVRAIDNQPIQKQACAEGK